MVGEEVKEARLLGKSPVGLYFAGDFFSFGVICKSGGFSSIVYGLFLVLGIFGFGGLVCSSAVWVFDGEVWVFAVLMDYVYLVLLDDSTTVLKDSPV